MQTYPEPDRQLEAFRPSEIAFEQLARLRSCAIDSSGFKNRNNRLARARYRQLTVETFQQEIQSPDGSREPFVTLVSLTERLLIGVTYGRTCR